MPESRLQRELKKRKPFASAAQEAVLNIVRTADQLQNRFQKLFRQYGLTGPQYNVLRILRGEGNPLPSLEIAERMIAVVPAITGVIDRLEGAGLVARRRCEQDRRVVYVEITPAGEKLLKQLDGPVDALHQELIGHLSEAQLRQLSRLLERSREGMPEA